MTITKYRLKQRDIYAGVRERTSEDKFFAAFKAGASIILGLFLLLAVYGWVGAADYAEQKEQEAANASASLRPALDIIEACVSDSTGKPIKVGTEWFLCGISPLGSFK